MQNRRTQIVINKKFQYQYSLLIVALTVLMVNGFIIVRLLFPGDNPLVMATDFAMVLAAIELILVAGVWRGSLKASHRIAGPVYVFSREVGKLGQGDLTAHIRLRDKDMFQETAQEMNENFAALRERITSLQEIGRKLRETEGQDGKQLLEQLNRELAAFTVAKAD